MDSLLNRNTPVDAELKAEMEAHEFEPSRVVLASFDSFELAHDVVEKLYDKGFEPHDVSVVADNLIFDDRLSGRFGSLFSAFRRSTRGATIGGILGLGFGLTSFFTPVVSALAMALYLIVFGAVVGAAVTFISHMFITRRQAFEAENGVYSDHYSVLVIKPRAVEARAALGG